MTGARDSLPLGFARVIPLQWRAPWCDVSLTSPSSRRGKSLHQGSGRKTAEHACAHSWSPSLAMGVTTQAHTHTHSSFCWSVLYRACVGMRARSCMWLWCVLPQRLNHRARAVKAPIRFPLCAWLHCRRKDCRCPAAVNAPPSPRCRASRPVTRARCPRGRWCAFCGLCRGLGANEKKNSEAHLPLPVDPVAACAVVGGGGAFMTTGGIEPPL